MLNQARTLEQSWRSYRRRGLVGFDQADEARDLWVVDLLGFGVDPGEVLVGNRGGKKVMKAVDRLD